MFEALQVTYGLCPLSFASLFTTSENVERAFLSPRLIKTQLLAACGPEAQAC